VAGYNGSGEDDHVKTWRGQRFWTCRCLDCGEDFYLEEPTGKVAEEMLDDDQIIDNEEELQAAEDELKKQIEDVDDRTCW
jgi:hypothetical protein